MVEVIVLSTIHLVNFQWGKCMGIEPTGPMISMGPDGFEDRGQHQLNKHFHY